MAAGKPYHNSLGDKASPETIRRREDKRAYYAANREKCLAYGAKWRANNKEKMKANYARRRGGYRANLLKRKYGLSRADFEAMRAAQGGCCAICREPFSKVPHVDHCHATGRNRALLCPDCNLGLGRFKDSPALLENAATYLRKHRRSELTLTRMA